MKILTEGQAEKFVALSIKKTADYIQENSLKGITVGISGGIDSAVVGVIGLKVIENLKRRNYPIEYKYLYLDCDSAPIDKEKAEDLAKKFNFTLEPLDLTPWYHASPLHDLIPKNHPRAKIAKGNIKCRLRMISLYHTAQLMGGIYLDTDDKSEEFMGFWTKHGDEGDVKFTQEVTKTEMYDLGEYLGVPESILSSPPGDGLKVTDGSNASDQLGLPYIDIEYIMSRFIGEGFDYNGSFDQLEDTKYTELLQTVAQEIQNSPEAVLQTLQQSLKTAFKRKHGDSAVNLLPERKDFGFLEVGSEEFNTKYREMLKSA